MDWNRNYITVSELNYYLKSIISAEELLKDVLLLGEVSRPKESGGNLYFDLKDEGGQIAVCAFQKGIYRPKDGEKVLITGSPDYYGKMGRISFIARKISPFGQGDLAAQLEALKEKLQQEGLFDPAHKVPIPRYPERVLVITSRQGAVIRDIYTTVRRYNQMIDLTLYDVRVQGEHAAEDIANALVRCDALGYDVIILARGGGSKEDLMPFNSEMVARALYLMQTPVISAVGHETDFSICDYVADERAATPTAAAERVAFEPIAEITRYTAGLKNFYSRLVREETQALDACKQLVRRLELARKHTIERANAQAAAASLRLGHTIERFLPEKEHRFALLQERLSANNPAALLQKGYAIVQKEGSNVRSSHELVAGDRVILQFSDGKKRALIQEDQNDV